MSSLDSPANADAAHRISMAMQRMQAAASRIDERNQTLRDSVRQSLAQIDQLIAQLSGPGMRENG